MNEPIELSQAFMNFFHEPSQALACSACLLNDLKKMFKLCSFNKRINPKSNYAEFKYVHE
jgi:hypothetical protein